MKKHDLSDTRIAAQMRNWIERFVIDLNLCPFARRPVEAGQLRIVVSHAVDEQALLLALHDELLRLHSTAPAALETTVLVIPQMLQDFLDYNDFLDLAEALLAQGGWQHDFQIASFHPDYRFAGSSSDDAANYSNRSPWPALHLLRERSVSAALENFAEPEQIPARNIARLREIGTRQLQQRLQRIIDIGTE